MAATAVRDVRLPPPRTYMRYYSPAIRQRVKAGPNTLGLQLARHAIRLDISIKEISYLVGASRMTVYNWYNGKAVTNAYLPRVKQLIEILKVATSSDAAWSQACQKLRAEQYPPSYTHPLPVSAS